VRKAEGRKQLRAQSKSWSHLVASVGLVLEATEP